MAKVGKLDVLVSLIAITVLAGCAPPMAPLPAAPSGLRAVAVQQPVNRTNAALVVNDPGLIGKAVGESRSTVPDLLADDLRSELGQRGFRVARAGAGDTPTLQVEIRRWAPYPADYSAVNVDLAATLVEGTSGRTLWSAQRRDWNVPTPDARSSIEASEMASQEIAATLLDGWQAK
jgi:hypothetical protein